MASPTDTRSSGLRWILSGVALVVVVVAVVIFLVAIDDDEPADVATDSTTTTETTESTTTTTESTTTTTSTTTTSAPTATSPPSEVDPEGVVFPDPFVARRFSDPRAVASNFATDVIGFSDPTLGEFRQGDQRSGEVPVSPGPDGPETTVLVRQLADDSWFVIGAVSPDITIQSPEARAQVDDPFEVAGEGLAFEGNIVYEVRTLDGTLLTEGTVTASGTPPPGPFSTQVDVPVDEETHLVLIMKTASARDGSIEKASAVPFVATGEG